MKDEIRETLLKIQNVVNHKEASYNALVETKAEDYKLLLDYITNLQQEIEKLNDDKRGMLVQLYKANDNRDKVKQENKIKDTNWESLKYYLEKLYYKDYIEEAISDDIDKKIKELESKVEIKGYQKDIKALQQENKRLKEDRAYAIGYIKNNYGKFTEIEVEKGAIKEKRYLSDFNIEHLLNILQNGSDSQ